LSKILIPIVKEYLADTLTPISIFKSLRPIGAKFLLESVEKGELWGRYSIIGMNPDAEIIIRNGKIQIYGSVPHLKSVSGAKPLEALRQILKGYRIKDSKNLPPFGGGLVGFMGYDILRYYENLPDMPVDDADFPDAHLFLSTHIVIYDHFKNSIKLIRLIPEDEDSAAVQKKIKDEMDGLVKKVNNGNDIEFHDYDEVSYKIERNFTKEDFKQAVIKAKEYIKQGEIFQVVLSQRMTYRPAPDPFRIYRRLRTINPSPYMYFLDFGKYQIVGSSPECLVKVQKETVSTYPIAGTRPRGETEEEDKKLAEELISDEKERAEHAMLVDLARNDIGKVSKFGTVKVEEYMGIENFSHVMHIVSRVTGTLASNRDSLDALISCLPAGTVSGAPKLRAMEIIDELEPTRRGPYAGAVGYFDFNGNMDTCITIRTMFFKDDCVYLQAGAGIVADSVPEKEYEETLNKLRALTKALEPDRGEMEI